MKTLKIRKGCHYSNELPKLICWKNSKCLTKTRKYCFTESCIYDIGEDQTDKNKLFGWSYGLHHKNSVRVGWYYDSTFKCVKLCLYVYDNGNVYKKVISNGIGIGKNVNIRLVSQLNGIGLIKYSLEWFYDEGKIFKTSYLTCRITDDLPNWGYTLCLYFGGNKTAPHDISVELLDK